MPHGLVTVGLDDYLGLVDCRCDGPAIPERHVERRDIAYPGLSAVIGNPHDAEDGLGGWVELTPHQCQLLLAHLNLPFSGHGKAPSFPRFLPCRLSQLPRRPRQRRCPKRPRSPRPLRPQCRLQARFLVRLLAQVRARPAAERPMPSSRGGPQGDEYMRGPRLVTRPAQPVSARRGERAPRGLRSFGSFGSP